MVGDWEILTNAHVCLWPYKSKSSPVQEQLACGEGLHLPSMWHWDEAGFMCTQDNLQCPPHKFLGSLVPWLSFALPALMVGLTWPPWQTCVALAPHSSPDQTLKWPSNAGCPQRDLGSDLSWGSAPKSLKFLDFSRNQNSPVFTQLQTRFTAQIPQNLARNFCANLQSKSLCQ